MSASGNPSNRGKTAVLQKRHSMVGPGASQRCLANKIAKILCDVLQPQPGHLMADIPSSTTSLNRPETLLPAATRILCLWKDKDEEEYHLTVIKEDKDSVFLDLPLSKLLSGTLAYDVNKQWHEVTLLDDNGEHARRLVFLLKSSTPDHAEAKDFNRKLKSVFDEIFETGGNQEEPQQEGQIWAAQNGARLEEGASVMRRAGDAAGNTMTDVSPAAGSEMAARQPLNKPHVYFPAKTIEQMTTALAAAIQTGNVQTAQELAALLAQAHTNVNVNYDTAAEEQKAREQEISVTVHVEDRESTGLILDDIKFKPSDTILDIKRSFFGKYNFPVEVQKWIIGKRIPGDEETLSKCDVNTSGHTLYLYLLNARAVNLTHDEERQQRQSLANPGVGNANENSIQGSRKNSDYETMNAPMVPLAGNPPTRGQDTTLSSADLNTPLSQVQGPPSGGGGGAMRQQSQLSAASSSSSLAATSFGLSDLRGNLEPPGSGPSSGQRGADTRGSPIVKSGQAEGAVGGMGQVVLTGGGGGMSDRRTLQGPPPQDIRQGLEQETVQGWQCSQCTLINQPTRPGCEACGNPRPGDYKVPIDFIVSEEERQRLERERQLEVFLQERELQEREHNYQRLLQADSSELVSNTEPFTCPICFDDIEPGQGVVLRECLHQFCRSCLTDTVRLAEEAELKCPFQDDRYKCDALLQDREVRALVPGHVYERYLRRSLDVAESQASNSYHCKTPDCRGWCIYEDLVNFFRCPVCRHENCLTCRAIHEDMNCKQYQEDLRIRAANDKAAQQTQVMLQEMLNKGEAMPCPQCEVIVQKKDGCDWIRCSICKTEICWVTKGPRWGPKGEGDTSGGCKCRVGGRRCHPKCNNCH